MPHITTRWRLTDRKHDNHKYTKSRRKLVGFRRSDKSTSSQSPLGKPRCVSSKMLAISPGAGSPRTPLSQSPQKQSLKTLLTPASVASAIFDSPLRPSPSSSISSSQSFDIIQRVNTPIAELEDTSRGYVHLELEDTSKAAIRSLSRLTISPFKLKSNHATSQSLVAAVDRHFADFEEDNRQLRRSLAAKEKSLMEANESAIHANKALVVAKDTIADRDFELEWKNRLIAELEEEVNHCQRHHLPPATPSKSRKADAPLSRFNADAPSVYTASPSPACSSFIAACKQSTKASSPNLTNGSPQFLTTGTFSAAASASARRGPLAKPHKPVAKATPAVVNSPVTTKCLTTALSSAAAISTAIASTSKQDSHYLRGYISSAKRQNPATISLAKLQRHQSEFSGRPRSSPNLHLDRHLRTSANSPPKPPMMSGGLGDPPDSNDSAGCAYEMEQKPSKWRGGLGDLFRLKD